MTNLYTKASKTEIHVVAERIMLLIEKLYDHYTDLYKKQNQGSTDGMLSFQDYAKEKIIAAGHSLGSQVLGSLGYQMNKKHGAKMGVLYGLDPCGVEFTHRGPTQKYAEFFHLDRDHAHRVVILLTEWQDRGYKHAEGHYNFYVNGPIEGRDEIQPGCYFWRHMQDSASCGHNRALNLFRTSLKIFSANSYDNLFIGFKYERNLVAIPPPGTEKHPNPTAVFSLVRKAESFGIFGINKEYREEPPEYPEIYLMPTAPCSPYNYIQFKTILRLPQQCIEYEENQNPLADKPDPAETQNSVETVQNPPSRKIMMKYYRFDAPAPYPKDLNNYHPSKAAISTQLE